jgi:hypothetical protein
MSFPYSAGFPYGFVAPPHEQPLSEISSLQISVDQNLGFATLDDWFPVPGATGNAAGGGGSSGGGSGTGPAGAGAAFGPGAGSTGTANAAAGLVPGAGPAGNPFEALDLADFWMKVGPGEAQGGFPFR